MALISDKAMQGRPGTKDAWLIEDGARGAGRLVGRITPAGARAFYYRYTGSTGDRVRLPIGTYDPKGDGRARFTVQQARDRARDLSALYRSGVKDLREHFAQQEADARQAEADARAAAEDARRAADLEAARQVTVRQLFERWAATDLQPRIGSDGKRKGRKDGGAYVRAQFERHVFPALGSLLVRDLRKGDLMAPIDARKAAGQARTATMLYADLRQMLAFAFDRDLIDADPMASIKRRKVVDTPTKRDRTLSDADVATLVSALPASNLSAGSQCAVWLILATAVRVGEAFGAVWADALPDDPGARERRLAELQGLGTKDSDGLKVGWVDLAKGVWHMPTTKNQRSHTVHLSAFALAQFEALRRSRPTLPDGELSPWVFPATDPTRPVCIKSFGKQLSDRQRGESAPMSNRTKRADALRLPGGKWTAHDLRRTAATIMARLGFGADVVNECLNHVQADQMAQVYIRDRRESEQAAAFDALGSKLASITGGQPAASNIVPLRAA